MNLLTQMDPFENKYFSRKWIAREVLKQSEEEMLAIQEEFDDSALNGNPFAEDGEGEDDEDSPYKASSGLC